MRFFLTCAAVCMAFAASAPSKADTTPSAFSGLRWRLAGPFRAGRALAVTGVPGQPDTFYFGAVGGGVWKSQNSGRTWNPISETLPDASIGAICVAPSDPSTIYIGAGEADMRNDIQHGHGVYKSTDAGKTWKHLGLDDSRQIGRIIVDPGDPDIVYVAALGHQYGPSTQRGVFKSTNGGKSWTKSLYTDADTGAAELAMDPNDSDVIYASMWQTKRPPWSYYPPSNGPGSGLYRSADAGKTWAKISGGGFPSFVGKTSVAVSPVDSKVVYAFVDTNNFKDGGIYRSNDSGKTWTHTDGEPRIWMRGWYFGGITADPKDANTVYVMNTSAYRSTDGGKHFIPFKGAPGGDDYHSCWISPEWPSHMIIGSDQGVIVSVDAGTSWSSWYNQPTAQLYHVVTDNRFPYWIYAAQQDSGAIAVPSRTIHTGISSLYQRPMDAGGESGTIAPDPRHPGLLYSSSGSREQFETGWEQNIDPTLGKVDTAWRSEWTQPIVFSPANPKALYTSHQKVFKSVNGGQSWETISPDLTRPTTRVPKTLDAATVADNDGQTQRGVVFWVAPSPIKAPQLWAGTDDGLLWLTQDDGKHWQNVSPPDLGPWSKVALIDASHFDAGTAYICIDRHRVDDDTPYIYRTRDFGHHWKRITNGIPGTEFVNVVREDPKRQGLLYAGTDWGIYYSLDDGEHWNSLKLNLPTASVRDVAFGGDDVVIATHGRSIWILDDVSPLRQSQDSQLKAKLFKPSQAVMFQRAGTFGFGAFDEGTPLPPEEPQGENAPWGALFDYVLPHSVTKAVLTIEDGTGKVLRTYSSSDRVAKVDLNQLDIPAYWVQPGTSLPTSEGGHRWIWNFKTKTDGGIAVPPDRYSVVLKADGFVARQTFDVVKDPRIAASPSDLHRQYEFALSVQDEIQVATLLRTRLEKRLKSEKSSVVRKRISSILGAGGTGTPDEGGTAATDQGSLRTILDGLNGVLGAVESAPAAPSTGAIEAFRDLKSRVAKLSATKL